MDDEERLVRDLVSVASPTGKTDAITRMLLERAVALGLNANVDPAGNVRMSTGTGGPRVLMLCHMDTVPGDLPVRVEEGVLHGRGSVDAKGCLAASISVAARIAGSASGTVEVVAVPDEEGQSLGARHLVEAPAPSAVIVGEPSGWQGVTIGYKGALRLRYVHTTPKVHAGMDGVNSAEAAVALWHALATRCAEEVEAANVPGTFRVPKATLEDISTSDDGTYLTTEMHIDVRLPPDHDTEGLLSFLENAMGDGQLKVMGREPAVVAPKNTPLVRALLAAIRAEGGKPVFKRKTGTSDMNLAAAAWPCVPIVAYGPGDSSLDHSPQERLDLSEYARAIRVIERTVRWLLAEEGGRSNL